MILNILIEEDIDVVIDKIVHDKDFEKSDTEIQTYESTELKYPQEYEDGGIIIMDDLNENEIKDPREKAMCELSRHNNLSIFIQSR